MSKSSPIDKLIMEPYYHLMKNGGKHLRGKLIKAFNVWLKIPDEKLNLITEIIDLLHNSSLLIDDIEDNSDLRRGIPVAHKIYGLALTLNCGNLCYFLALQKTLDTFPKDKLIDSITIFSQQMILIHKGQGMDIYWRDNLICPSEEEYLQMIDNKTGGLFNFGIRLMQLFSDCDRDMTQLVSCLGQYFQIRDDFANLKSEEYKKNKSFAEDFTEGKYSFPIIHAIKSHTEDSVIQDILKKRTHDSNLKKYAIKKMEEFGSFEYSIKRMKELDIKAVELINEMGGNPELIQFLSFLRKEVF